MEHVLYSIVGSHVGFDWLPSNTSYMHNFISLISLSNPKSLHHICNGNAPLVTTRLLLAPLTLLHLLLLLLTIVTTITVTT